MRVEINSDIDIDITDLSEGELASDLNDLLVYDKTSGKKYIKAMLEYEIICEVIDEIGLIEPKFDFNFTYYNNPKYAKEYFEKNCPNYENIIKWIKENY